MGGIGGEKGGVVRLGSNDPNGVDGYFQVDPNLQGLVGLKEGQEANLALSADTTHRYLICGLGVSFVRESLKGVGTIGGLR